MLMNMVLIPGRVAVCPEGHEHTLFSTEMWKGGWTCPECGKWYHNREWTDPKPCKEGD